MGKVGFVHDVAIVGDAGAGAAHGKMDIGVLPKSVVIADLNRSTGSESVAFTAHFALITYADVREKVVVIANVNCVDEEATYPKMIVIADMDVAFEDAIGFDSIILTHLNLLANYSVWVNIVARMMFHFLC